MKLLYATNNIKKVDEFKLIIKENSNLNIEFFSLINLNYKIEVEENKKTLKENSYKKAFEIWQKEKDNFDYIVSEDFGFFCEAFPNIMGVKSKRWLSGSDEDRSIALIKKFKNIKNRNAYYKSVFTLFNKKGEYVFFEEILKGKIANKVSKKKSFAYDSVFILDNNKYLSEYSIKEKNKISSRGKAILKLIDYLVEKNNL